MRGPPHLWPGEHLTLTLIKERFYINHYSVFLDRLSCLCWFVVLLNSRLSPSHSFTLSHSPSLLVPGWLTCLVRHWSMSPSLFTKCIGIWIWLFSFVFTRSLKCHYSHGLSSKWHKFNFYLHILNFLFCTLTSVIFLLPFIYFCSLSLIHPIRDTKHHFRPVLASTASDSPSDTLYLYFPIYLRNWCLLGICHLSFRRHRLSYVSFSSHFFFAFSFPLFHFDKFLLSSSFPLFFTI